MNYSQNTPVPASFDQTNPTYSPVYTPYPFDPLYVSNQIAALAAENTRLNERLKQKNLQERADLEIFEGSDNCTYTFSKHMRPKLLMTGQVECAFLCIPPLMCRTKPYLAIHLRNHDRAILIEEAAFHKSGALLSAILSQGGVSVHLIRSEHHTAALIRSAISQHMKSCYLDFYAGWHLENEHTAIYRVFADGKTHLSRYSVHWPVPARESFTAAERTTAVQRYSPVFSLISDRNTRAFIVLWFHCCQLSSLLRALGHPMPMGLCLFAPSPGTQNFFRHLFAWHSDPILSVAATPSAFCEDLLFRKDQPLLIADDGRASAANLKLLEAALTDGQVPWKHGTQTYIQPVHALPTIISSCYTSMCCLPTLLTLDLDDDLIDTSLYDTLPVDVADHKDYRTAFIDFVTPLIPILRGYLRKRKKEVDRHASSELDGNTADMFAVMLGVADLLNDFFRSCNPVSPPVTYDKDFPDWLLQQLVYHSEISVSCGSLADQFVRVTRSLIQTGKLTLCKVEDPYTHNDSTAVYADTRSFCFPSGTFRTICAQLCESRPVILRELEQAGMIFGPFTNSGTTMTRIGLRDTEGKLQRVSVYRLDRTFFETLGDPWF